MRIRPESDRKLKFSNIFMIMLSDIFGRIFDWAVHSVWRLTRVRFTENKSRSRAQCYGSLNFVSRP